MSADQLLEVNRDHRRESRDAARDVILLMLRKAPVRAETLLDTLDSMGHSNSTALRARRELKQEGLIDRRKVDGKDPHWEWFLVRGAS